MKRPRRFLLFLYPRQWRERYQREMDALLEDAPFTWSDFFDLLKGALLMRVSGFARRPIWQTLVLFVIAGAIAGGVGSRWMQTQFLSSATLRIEGDRTAFGDFHAKLKEALSRKQLTSVIAELNLYPQERTSMPLEDVAERMRRHVKVSLIGSANAPTEISVAFVYTDARSADLVVRELVRKLMQNPERSRASTTPTTIVDATHLPAIPISPNVRTAVAMGALGGLLIGILVAAWTARSRAQRHQSA